MLVQRADAEVLDFFLYENPGRFLGYLYDYSVFFFNISFNNKRDLTTENTVCYIDKINVAVIYIPFMKLSL